jgi:DNA-binding SARP family transcriptional activator
LSIEGRSADVPAAVNQRKRLAFLALLAASGPHGIARERLLLLLWPESTTDRARGALYQLLHVVRQAFGEESVVGTDELRLETRIVDSDVSNFIGAVARGDLAAAVNLYGGPFMDGVHLPDAPELERWIEQKRQELTRSYQSALARLAGQALEVRDYSAAIAFAERLVAVDPLSARATVLLMEALAAGGDVASALERGRVHATLVREELGTDVDVSVSALAARLRSESQRTNAGIPVPATVKLPESAVQELVSAPLEKDSGARLQRAAELTRVDEAARGQSPFWPSVRFAIRRFAVAGGVLMGVGVLASALWLRSPATLIDSGTLSPRDTLVLAEFEVTGLDSSLAPALTTILRRDFADSRTVSLMPSSAVRSALERMRRRPETPILPELAREIGRREGSRAVLSGRVSRLASGYLVTLRLIESETGNELASVASTAASPERDLLPALSRAGQDLRGRIGESLRDAKRNHSPERLLTTTSLEASRLMWAGSGASRTVEQRISAERAAIRLDSAFAYAWMSIGNQLSWTGYRSAARDSALSMAYRFRDNLTPMERAQVSFMYWSNVQRDRGRGLAELESALAVDTTLFRAVPLNITEALLETRQFEAAEGLARRIERWKNVGELALYAVARAQTARGEYAAADSTVARRRSHDGPKHQGSLSLATMIALSTLRFDSAEVLLEKAPEETDVAIGERTGLLRLRRSLAEARLMADRLDSIHASIAAAAGARFDPGAGRSLALAREALWLKHDPAAAVAFLDTRWRSPPQIHDIQDRIDGMQAAALYAAAGRPTTARAHLVTFENGADTLAKRATYEHRQAVLAEIALTEGRFNDAMRLFRASDLGADGLPVSSCAVCVLPNLARVAGRAGWSDSVRVFWEEYVSRPAIERLSTDQWFLATAYGKLAVLANEREDYERAATYRGALMDLRKQVTRRAP